MIFARLRVVGASHRFVLADLQQVDNLRLYHLDLHDLYHLYLYHLLHDHLSNLLHPDNHLPYAKLHRISESTIMFLLSVRICGGRMSGSSWTGRRGGTRTTGTTA